jgi:hypothetical protein
MTKGFLSFVPPGSFFDPSHKLSNIEKASFEISHYIDERGAMPETSNWTWHEVSRAIKRTDEFAIEATSANYRASLTFNLRNNEIGSYSIRQIVPKFFEEGSPFRVFSVRKNSEDFRFGRILDCETRFVVFTKTKASPVTVKIWIVGFNNAIEAEPE